MMQTTELSPTKSLLHDAAKRLTYGRPLPATALRVLAEWLDSWVNEDVDEDEPTPKDLAFATRAARAILGPEGRR
ncbi:hypothetical protein [Streptomyces sp. 8L]|uniref:hypothetical protein n=1 Tax=Streptomyces sp. 8L TaxID=2877242 RepID=UPI001CD7D9DC|nr:hypothetical protein [Streptomyces sp. 8L]MCA1222444.1 hypothetical protein [Streptomyces sp. 8L]